MKFFISQVMIGSVSQGIFSGMGSPKGTVLSRKFLMPHNPIRSPNPFIIIQELKLEGASNRGASLLLLCFKYSIKNLSSAGVGAKCPWVVPGLASSVSTDPILFCPWEASSCITSQPELPFLDL